MRISPSPQGHDRLGGRAKWTLSTFLFCSLSTNNPLLSLQDTFVFFLFCPPCSSARSLVPSPRTSWTPILATCECSFFCSSSGVHAFPAMSGNSVYFPAPELPSRFPTGEVKKADLSPCKFSPNKAPLRSFCCSGIFLCVSHGLSVKSSSSFFFFSKLFPVYCYQIHIYNFNIPPLIFSN